MRPQDCLTKTTSKIVSLLETRNSLSRALGESKFVKKAMNGLLWATGEFFCKGAIVAIDQ